VTLQIGRHVHLGALPSASAADDVSEEKTDQDGRILHPSTLRGSFYLRVDVTWVAGAKKRRADEEKESDHQRSPLPALTYDPTGLQNGQRVGSVYHYQGEELGLHEVYDLPLDVPADPVWERSGHTRKGRDGCRVPIPWTKGGPSFGFGPARSWLLQPDDWGGTSVEAQRGVDVSILELYEGHQDPTPHIARD
jgi:hypothetical protein